MRNESDRKIPAKLAIPITAGRCVLSSLGGRAGCVRHPSRIVKSVGGIFSLMAVTQLSQYLLSAKARACAGISEWRKGNMPGRLKKHRECY